MQNHMKWREMSWWGHHRGQLGPPASQACHYPCEALQSDPTPLDQTCASS
jgi:hypothetical protein